MAVALDFLQISLSFFDSVQVAAFFEARFGWT
jgi:hypothetical protein